MPERSYTATKEGYRFGFNGMEQDDEVSGSGNSYDYGFRVYNPRIAKFLSVDPLSGSYPWYTPYQFAGNSPILNIDLDGLEEWDAVANWSDKAGGYITMFLLVNKEGSLKINWTITDNANKTSNHVVSSYASDDQKGRAQKAIVNSEFKKRADGKNVKQLGFQYLEKADLKGILDPKKSTTPVSPDKLKPKESAKKPKSMVVENAPKEPKPTTELIKFRLSISFNQRRKSFSDEAAATKVLTPVLNYLNADSRNSVTLSPNTGYKKGFDLPDFWGAGADGDLADDLVKLRGETITKWFTDRGADPSQITISITDKNFNTAPSVSGTLKVYEKKK